MYWIDLQYQQLRKEYDNSENPELKPLSDPLTLFRQWLDDAIKKQEIEPTAMTIATSKNNIPDARIVLLKAMDENGFYFFSNYKSAKGQQLEINPHASLVFFWPMLQRQVRMMGSIEKPSTQLSDEYFHSRPLESKISAVVSPQSSPIQSIDELHQMAKDLRVALKDKLNRPNEWGAYYFIANKIEFWQGRPNRLHERMVYEKKNNEWATFFLAP